jgi:hypothetical protein
MHAWKGKKLYQIITKVKHKNKIKAYKINKHPKAPNFLTHVLWSKTILGKQQAHLELLLI